MTWINLDRDTALYAQQMVKDDHVEKDVLERLVTKALGVLQEQGVYALILFLHSRSNQEEKNAARAILNGLYRLLKDENRSLPPFANKDVPRKDAGTNYALNFYANHVANDLSTLLLVRDVYEQCLTYARYHAKAVKSNETARAT